MEKEITYFETAYDDAGNEIAVEVTRKLKSTALLPRLYRNTFGRDLMIDMQNLTDAYKSAQEGGGHFSAVDLTVFEDLAWLMLKHAGEDVGETPEEWLDRIAGMFTVYSVLPVIIDLWNAGQKTTAIPAKK